ncbi:MAG: hypothetical protein FWB97_02825 [Oscillospiraceae bacterium]|nr:hypothetical protein [Oscillospiraceae bacterium]
MDRTKHTNTENRTMFPNDNATPPITGGAAGRSSPASMGELVANLDSVSARNAIILSEIIGPPISRRRRRR